MSLRIVFAGTPGFAVPALAAVHARHRVTGVLTQPDRPAGRGLALSPSAVKVAATELGLPLLQPATLKAGTADGDAARAQLRDWQPDVAVVVAYGLLLPPDVLAVPVHGCLNIHASLLPRWRGAAPIQRAVLAGDAESGVSIMQMAEGLDTGDVVLAAALPIGASQTSGELHDALAALGARLIVEALDHLAAGALGGRAQDPAAVTYAAKLDKAEAAIDWRLDAVEIDRRIRGYAPWPGATTRWRDEPVRLFRSRLLEQSGRAGDPGAILGVDGDWLRVAAAAGVVGVGELQRAGRKRVTARDFANAELRGDAPARFG